jgi:hypothetical protein
LQESGVTGTSWTSGTLWKNEPYCYYIESTQGKKSNIVKFTTP